jgi:branched-chain amino acid transport system ATP-binding protein
MDERALLQIRGVVKQFGGLLALDGVGFEVRPGEFFGLIGPNGAGKSVLINIVSGLYKPTKGSVMFDGRDVTNLRPHVRHQLGMSRTFQHSTLFFELSVLENIMMGVRAISEVGFLGTLGNTRTNRRRDEEIGVVAEQTVDLLGLKRYREEPAGKLPYGLQKIVSIGMAVASKPKLLLLDEPLTGLIAFEVDEVMRHIASLNRQGITVLIVEHNMRAVMGYCNRIMVLSFGNKIAEGSPSEIQKDEKVIKSYLGE